MRIFTELLRKAVMSISATKPNIVFVLGNPGAGKGTQCEKIVQTFKYVHLSAGDLLRAERQNPSSQYGTLIEEYITDGRIVPVEITCSLLERAMNESSNNKFLIDGFPRNKDNLDGWEKAMNEKVNLQFVLFFDCSQEICKERCLARGLSGSGRSDDNATSLEKRFVTYVKDTMPIIDHYDKQNLVKKIDGTQNPDKVFEDVRELFE